MKKNEIIGLIIGDLNTIYMETETHMATKLQRVQKYAEIKNIGIMAGAFVPTKLIHLDGSTFNLTYGCFERFSLEGTDFVILYGEHYHPMVFYNDDVEFITGKEIFPKKNLDN